MRRAEVKDDDRAVRVAKVAVRDALKALLPGRVPHLHAVRLAAVLERRKLKVDADGRKVDVLKLLPKEALAQARLPDARLAQQQDFYHGSLWLHTKIQLNLRNRVAACLFPGLFRLFGDCSMKSFRMV